MPATDNPQVVPKVENPANDASRFQQSAGSDVLTQKNQALSVEKTGEPINTAVTTDGASVAVVLFVIISSVTLVLVALYVFRAVLKRPSKEEKETELLTAVAADVHSVDSVQKAVIKTSGKKKKQSRSKRKKAAKRP